MTEITASNNEKMIAAAQLICEDAEGSDPNVIATIRQWLCESAVRLNATPAEIAMLFLLDLAKDFGVFTTANKGSN